MAIWIVILHERMIAHSHLHYFSTTKIGNGVGTVLGCTFLWRPLGIETRNGRYGHFGAPFVQSWCVCDA